jgi:molybdenum cofactor guanylyltransferase
MKQVGGFILAGGESSRMGQPKALLALNGSPLVLHVARLIEPVAVSAVVIGPPGTYRPLGLRAIADDFPRAGPLGGIATALRAAEEPWNLVVACDLPYLTRAWLEYLVARALASPGDAVIPMNERGAEPLCAMYHQRCAAAIREALARGTRKVTDGLARLRVESIAPADWKAFDSDGFLFKNMNSPEEYEEAKARIERRAGQ